MNPGAELGDIIGTVVRALTALDVPYFVTGSVASSIHGEFRATNDVDFVAAVSVEHVQPFCAALDASFIADREQATQSIEVGASFNLIHRTTYLKVDVFPMRRAFEIEAARRAEFVQLPGILAAVRVATAEDILLAKLSWYRMGGEESEVQRRDIRSLIALNHESLDAPYLHQWSETLAVRDLLERFLE